MSAEPTRIVASVAVATRSEAVVVRAAIKAAGDVSDWIELRADGWRESGEKLVEAVAMMDRPVIATVRPPFSATAPQFGSDWPIVAPCGLR